MCPIEDSTTKSRPRMLAMFLALAGDSTMTRGLGMARAGWAVLASNVKQGRRIACTHRGPEAPDRDLWHARCDRHHFCRNGTVDRLLPPWGLPPRHRRAAGLPGQAQ